MNAPSPQQQALQQQQQQQQLQRQKMMQLPQHQQQLIAQQQYRQSAMSSLGQVLPMLILQSCLLAFLLVERAFKFFVILPHDLTGPFIDENDIILFLYLLSRISFHSCMI